MRDFANDVARFLLDVQSRRTSNPGYQQAFAGIRGVCAAAGFDLETALEQARGSDPNGQKLARLADSLRAALRKSLYLEGGIREVLEYHNVVNQQGRYVTANDSAAPSDGGVNKIFVAVVAIGILALLFFCICGMG